MLQNYRYRGLSDDQIAENRIKHGENILSSLLKESLWIQFFKKFEDPIIRILLLVLLASTGTAVYQYYYLFPDQTLFVEPAGILVAILLTTCIGFIFEWNANKKFEILSQFQDNTLVKTIRNGYNVEVLRREIVVGDIVLLETGDEIPADGKLHEADSLQINESALTGELIAQKTTLLDSCNQEVTYPSDEVLKGTYVIDGNGIMEVTKVGNATEYGKIYEGLKMDSSVETPLTKQLKRLGKLIAYVSYLIAGLIVLVRIILYFKQIETNHWKVCKYMLDTIMIAVATLVMAIPEGLPMSITLSLALSMKKMLVTNNLVRKMHACEIMGATTVICTDKTGTLTQNQMQVYQTYFPNLNEKELMAGKIGRFIAEGIAVNATAHLDFSKPERIRPLGNPTEGSLLLWLYDRKINYLTLREQAEIIKQLPFSTERKYMATIVNSAFSKKKILYLKGAPEIIWSHCQSISFFEDLAYWSETYQDQAMRTLGFAYKIIEDHKKESMEEEDQFFPYDLTFLGIAAISDPIRAEVPKAIQTCLKAGINIKIVTGDTSRTAKEVGRQVGLWSEEDTDRQHLTGQEFSKLPDEHLLERVMDLKILSRARPMDKERLVKLLQRKNQIVVVTGDGTNDASALNMAHVGLSMGDGTSVAKAASDITILDNSFSSISRAVMWGRSLYQNIQRFILFQMTTNITVCLIVLISAILEIEPPMTITQMLWINLIMDTFAVLALATLPPNENVMNEKTHPIDQSIITIIMRKNILGTSLLFTLTLFGWLQYFNHTDLTNLMQFRPNYFIFHFFDFKTQAKSFSPYERSVFFTFFVLLQFWNMFNAKAFNTSQSAFFQLKKCFSGFGWIVFIIILGQYLIVTWGGKIFHVAPLHISDWAILFSTTSIVLLIGEVSRSKMFFTNKLNFILSLFYFKVGQSLNTHFTN